MKITQAGIDLIKSRESCRLKAYKCPAGIWTIGYGHTGSEVHDGWEISQDEAETLLRSDLLVFDAGVQRDCAQSTDCQHSAMVSLAYNIGLGNFAKSSVMRLHNADRYAEAAQAFALWNKAGGKVLAGLVSRRAAEAALYLEDLPQETISAVPNADGEKSLTDSRTMNGQAIAGTATVAGTGLSALNAHSDTLSQITDQLGGIASYLPQIGYAIAALTIGGIALSIYGRWRDRQEGRA